MLKWNDIIDTIREKKISGKVITMAAALLVLTGLVGIRQSIPTSSTVGDRELPIYCVETQEPKIALTFDAAWGNEDTQKIMEILRKHNVKVTFFMTGGWVEHYPDDVKMILAEGHDLGNHSENHKNMSQLADSEKETELMKVHEKVKNLTGYEMFLFRPPYGDYDNAVVKTAKKCGYYTIQWDVDSLDWKDSSTADSICDRVLKKVCPGSIVLFHNDADNTPAALPEILECLKNDGYEFVFISDLILKENYTIDHTGKQCKINS